MHQKSNNNQGESNSYIYFAFMSDTFDVSVVSKELKIEPTSTTIKKEPVPKSTYWEYRINAGNDFNLESYMDRLIGIFETKVDIINHLKEKYKLETRLQLVIEIEINPSSSTPFFGLNNKIINFLSKTTTEVDFDLYKVDTMGLLNNLD